MRADALLCVVLLTSGCAGLTPPVHGGARAFSQRGSPAPVLPGSVESKPTPRTPVADGGEEELVRHRRGQRVRMPGSIAIGASPEAMTRQAVEPGLLEADVFERLLVSAGLDDASALPPKGHQLTPDDAARVLGLLLTRPVTLGNFPPRMAAGHLLREVLEGGAVSQQELLRRVERFGGVAVLRPDGCVAWALSGKTQQRIAPVEWKDGAFRAHGFELGRFYDGRSGVYRLLDARFQLEHTPFVTEVYSDSDLVGCTLDGAQEAFVELALAIGGLFARSPDDALSALKNLPAGVAALIVNSPEYLERFRYMTEGEQIRAVSKLVTNLVATWGAATATTRTLRGMSAGAEVTVPVLSLSKEGTLAVKRIAASAESAASVLSGGPGAAIILQRASTAAKGSAPSGGPGQWAPAHESMKPRARRYQEQITGRSADDSYWVGGVGKNSGGVKFDGFEDGVLLEAKGPGYAKFFEELVPKRWFRNSGAKRLIEQAQRQLDVVRGKGIPVRWHVAEAEAADAIQALLDSANIRGIEVVYTAPLSL